MIFNEHWGLKGKHAFLSPSSYHWVGYDTEKLIARYNSYLAVERGTKLHEFAKDCIELGIKLPRSKKTLNLYVNDAIGFKMTPEQPLYYSDNCFGTADAISFRNDFLRIHDLKTGVSPTNMKQLEIYEALFCLEYGVKPHDIRSELRIYQNDDVSYLEPDPDDIADLMLLIVDFDKVIMELKAS